MASEIDFNKTTNKFLAAWGSFVGLYFCLFIAFWVVVLILAWKLVDHVTSN